MRKLLYSTFLFLSISQFITAQGTWLPMYLKKYNEKEMKSMGCKLSADDIYSFNKSSVKDAICQFDGGCTAEVISNDGLLLTNHHCGFDAIQQLSTLEHNYVEDGFWAKNRSGELPAEGVVATFVTRMENVTEQALQNVTADMTESSRQAEIDKNIKIIKSTMTKEAHEEILVRAFFDGNEYYAFVTVTYKDLRLVGTPPSSIGKFGSDTDNWVWPRHTGDFSMFRIYAGPDNKPAEYSPNNVPFHPKHSLPISLKGIKEDDFTMVYGFPGRTSEYLPGTAVQLTGDVLDPVRVGLRERALKEMDNYMRKDPAVKIEYIANYAYIANGWKKWLGEMQGLKNYHAYDKKAAYEAEFTRRVNEGGLKEKYGNLLPNLNELWKKAGSYYSARDYFLESIQRNNKLLAHAGKFDGWVAQFAKNGEKGFMEKLPDMKKASDDFLKNYFPQVDRSVITGLLQMFAEGASADVGSDIVKAESAKHGSYDAFTKYIFDNSVLVNAAKMKELLASANATDIKTALENDPAVSLFHALNDKYTTNIQPKTKELEAQISALQRTYMKAQMKIFKEKNFFPDANSTLRVTYGKVKPYRPRDGVTYKYQTDLDGVMEKYIPGDYEFDVPKKLISLWETKDYGRYADKNGQLPVAFIATNHTTGGNSGSPALDARGNLIGLNFDRVWEGTMSDLNFDPAICRNIMVDIRYVLFIVDKFADAGYLLEEMKIVK